MNSCPDTSERDREREREQESSFGRASCAQRPLNGSFSRAVFNHGEVPENRGCSSLNGAFPLLNAPSSKLNGPLPRMSYWAVFLLKRSWKIAHQEKAH